jgi:hypothetical protein
MMSLLFVVLFAVAASANIFDTKTSFAWVHSDGKVVSTSREYPVNITRIDVGEYCFSISTIQQGVLNYAAVSITIQSMGSYPPSPASGQANTGYGDNCNPYGGYSVVTFANGKPVDQDFSMIIMW